MLTEADHRILKVIQAEGRITNQELANRCGLSPSACFDRLKRLREQEYILGFHALLDPNKLEDYITAMERYLRVYRTDHHSQRSYDYTSTSLTGRASDLQE